MSVLLAEKFFKKIRPYTIIKSPEIDKAISFISAYRKEQRHGIGHGLSSKEIELRRRLYNDLRQLKKKRYL